MILCIETATAVCSAALCSGPDLAGLRESAADRSHASLLTVYIEELLSQAGIEAAELDAVAVSKGPGSFTGLRIGVSAAKGIAFAASIPLIGIETTRSMFHGILSLPHTKDLMEGETLFCPMIDARRMEVYYSLFNSTGRVIKQISAEVIGENSFTEYPSSSRIIFFGDGALKYKGVLKRPNIIFEENYRISASHMAIPANEALVSGKFENVAYFEPHYFKDFITTKPVKNILGNFSAG
jgi:tRNA threonylcarbamoyladenosine biosynthesis protein TsaB